jgi:hypothetical protein
MSESEHSYRRRRLENADAVKDGNGSEGFENDVDNGSVFLNGGFLWS